MSATISELIKAIQEGIQAKDPKEVFIHSELESILWKINSGRMKDLDLSDTLRVKEIIKTNIK